MTRLLCVHPEPRAFEPLRRALLECQRDWDLIAVPGAREALASLANGPADAVIVAHVPPALDARALLLDVRDRSPEAVRVLMASHAHEAAVAAAQSAAHRTLPSDAGPAALIETLRQSFALHALVSAPGMRSLVGRIGDLPGVPRVYALLTRRLDSGDTSIEEIAELLEDDGALAARVLKLANSAYFGRDQAVTSLGVAAARLGTRLLKGLVLTAEVDDRFDGSVAGFDRDRYQRHVTLVARIASSLEPRAAWKDDAFTGGLLHDVGKLVLASRMPEVERENLAAAAQQDRPLHEIERERLGVHHGAIGAYLLGLWGLPSVLVDAAARHHDVAFDRPLTLDAPSAVALANRLARDVCGAGPAGVRAGADAGEHDPRWEWWIAMADQLAHEGLAAA
jgi:HD-like signal output (HDOD) protein